MSFFTELKRRNVIRVGILYAVSSWLILQVADVLAGLFSLPDWTLRFVGFVLLLGFLPALVFSWVYELTPDGLKRESDIREDASITAHTGRRINAAIALLLVVAVGLLAVQTFAPGEEPTVEPLLDDAPAITENEVEQPARAPTDGPSTDERRSIAVLPFVNMSLEAENEVFSDGISEEILNVLAKIPELKVAARTSSFQFKGQNLDVGAIAQTLGVQNVLEGSVRRAGKRVRVTAQLIQASDGFHLWSESYDRDLTDIFAIQDEIAGAIATAMKTTLRLGTEKSRSNLTGTTSLEAYELYLEGMQQWHLREADSLLRAQSLFEQAIGIDPNFAKAHAGLGLAFAVLPSYLSVDQRPYTEAARAAARRAIELDPTNAEAYAVLAQTQPGPEADPLYERAIELKPSFATAYQWQGTGAQSMGELERALELLERGYELDPRSRIIGTNLAWVHWAMDRYDEALEVVADVKSYAPDYNELLETEFLVRVFMNDADGLRGTAEAMVRSLGKRVDPVEDYLALLDDSTVDDAVRTLRSWPLGSRLDPDSPMLIYDYDVILVLAHLGFHEDAEQVLRTVADRSVGDATFILGNRSLADFYCRPKVVAIYESIDIPFACLADAP